MKTINQITKHVKWDNLTVNTYENWVKVSRYVNIPFGFIRKYQDKVLWVYISSSHRHFSKKFIHEFAHKIDWNEFCWYNYDSLTVDLIREFKDKVNWYYISQKYNLTIEFAKEFYKELDWTHICSSRRLTEEFIEAFDTFKKYSGRINWRLISEYQRLSETFIRKYEKRLPWYNIFRYQHDNVSQEFINEFKAKYPIEYENAMRNLKLNKNS